MLADSKNYKMAKGGTQKNFHLRVIALEVKMMDFRKKSTSFKNVLFSDHSNVYMPLRPYNVIFGSF